MSTPTVKSIELNPVNFGTLNNMVAKYLAEGFQLLSAVPLPSGEIHYTFVKWDEPKL